MISLRQAEVKDAELVYPWRNDLQIRRFFFNKEEVPYSSHVQWFESSLKQDSRHMFIVFNENQPIGFLRFDVDNERAEIDIYIDPNQQGHGFGAEALRAGIHWAKYNLPGVKKLQGLVLKENVASQRIFEKTGFDLAYLAYEYPLIKEIK